MNSSEYSSTEDSYQPSQLFLIRIWRENLGNGYFECRAYIQHNLSGEARFIRNWQELESFYDQINKPATPLPDCRE